VAEVAFEVAFEVVFEVVELTSMAVAEESDMVVAGEGDNVEVEAEVAVAAPPGVTPMAYSACGDSSSAPMMAKGAR
jgi:hypothetical protein